MNEYLSGLLSRLAMWNVILGLCLMAVGLVVSVCARLIAVRLAALGGSDSADSSVGDGSEGNSSVSEGSDGEVDGDAVRAEVEGEVEDGFPTLPPIDYSERFFKLVGLAIVVVGFVFCMIFPF